MADAFEKLQAREREKAKKYLEEYLQKRTRGTMPAKHRPYKSS
jgi:hypothetical protein